MNNYLDRLPVGFWSIEIVSSESEALDRLRDQTSLMLNCEGRGSEGRAEPVRGRLQVLDELNGPNKILERKLAYTQAE